MRTTRCLGMAVALGVAVVIAPLSIGASASAASKAAWCQGSQLAVSFAIVRGSHAAGNVDYALRVKNVSSSTCSVGGLAGLQLLGKNGEKLPTHVTDANPGVTAVIVTLKPGLSAWADDRFSPDVPGPGEGHPGRCELTSYKVSVTVPPLGDSVVGPVRQPTSVCEHGSISLSLLESKRPTG